MESYSLQDYHYSYPPKAIAILPAKVRDKSKLFVIHRKSQNFESNTFYKIGNFLKKGDVLVLNDVRVLPVRLQGVRKGGGRSEILLTGVPKQKNILFNHGNISSKGQIFEALISRGRKIRLGTNLFIQNGHPGKKDPFLAKVLEKRNDGRWLIRISSLEEGPHNVFSSCGKMPLPPYLQKNRNSKFQDLDQIRYQTVFAKKGGALAAPTAGLHFSNNLILKLKKMGIEVHKITLNVSFGTFRPIRSKDIRDHQMEPETFEISSKTALAINRAKKEGRRVIAVGTTATRTLESAAQKNGQIQAMKSATNLYIYPGFRFRVIDGLLTNFHLPQSSLLLLVSAFTGREIVLKAYQEAIGKGFRLFSYGDAMLII